MVIQSQKQNKKIKNKHKKKPNIQNSKHQNIEKIKKKETFFFFLEIITESGELGDNGSDTKLTDPAREIFGQIDVVAETRRR